MKQKLILIMMILLSSSKIYAQKNNGTEFIELLFGKKYAQAYEMFSPTLKEKITVEVLEQSVQAISKQLGNRKKTIEINEESDGKYTTYYHYTEFDNSKLDFKIILNKENKIESFTLVQHKTFNSNNYYVPCKIKPLPGTLLIPTSNKKILAILIHGSGPNDRDETTGPNKPFKDIADELFKQGIATYRYDKRTNCALESLPNNMTVHDEVTNDVINMVHFFHSNDTFKDYKIVLIGHSLGGMMLPFLGENLKSAIAGMIMMAGPSFSFQTKLQQQYAYLYKQNPTTEMKEEIKKLNRQVENLSPKNFKLSLKNEDLPLTLSASYWKSLLDYNQLKTMENITIPTIILQGENDYQVTMDDFNLWKKQLINHKNVAFKSYKNLFHLFIKSEDVPSPKDYEIVGHVEQEVIDDMTIWMKNLK